jgi:hypothetical protein
MRPTLSSCPGFVDSHRHMCQARLRNILPNGLIDSDYPHDISGTARTSIEPKMYVRETFSPLWALNVVGVSIVFGVARAFARTKTRV